MEKGVRRRVQEDVKFGKYIKALREKFHHSPHSCGTGLPAAVHPGVFHILRDIRRMYYFWEILVIREKLLEEEAYCINDLVALRRRMLGISRFEEMYQPLIEEGLQEIICELSIKVNICTFLVMANTRITI